MVIISASLFGFLGILLAAPVLASVKLILTYLIRKLSDQDPWMDLKVIRAPDKLPVVFKRQWRRVKKSLNRINQFFTRLKQRKPSNQSQQLDNKKGENND